MIVALEKEIHDSIEIRTMNFVLKNLEVLQFITLPRCQMMIVNKKYVIKPIQNFIIHL